jgi:penicillin-binding protein 1A
MGITSTLHGYPAETLGGLENGVSPLEMATAYSTIASGGYRNRPLAIKRIVFPGGRVEEGDKLPPRFRVKRVKVFEDGVTAEATQILEQNIQRGTGTRAAIGCPAAGKTGTTDNNTDAWFVGFTPRLTTAVWVGYPDRDIQMNGLFYGGNVDGGTFPAQIWGDYMSHIKGSFCGGFRSPKVPFSSAPFYGRYSSSHGSAVGGPEGDQSATTTPYTQAPAAAAPPVTTPAPAGGEAKPDKGKKGGFDPTQYESAPQPSPATGGAPAQGGAQAPDGTG